MNDFIQVYNIISSKLPFSIIGYDNLDKTLYGFYDEIVDSNFIRLNQDLSFVFSAFAKIRNDNSQIVDMSKIINWDIQSYDKIYFKTLVGTEKRTLLSFYFFLLSRNHYQIFNEHSSPKPSIVFSKLFYRSMTVHISLAEIIKPVVDWDSRNGRFSIVIPKDIFKKKNHCIHERFRFTDTIKEYFVKSDLENRRYFQVEGQNYSSLNFDNYFLDLYDVEKMEKYSNTLNTKLALFDDSLFFGYPIDKSLEESTENKKKLYKEFVSCIFSLSYLCFHFCSDIEYFLGDTMVENYSRLNKNNKPFEKTGKRHLGGIIIGYKSPYSPTQFERTTFKLISNHVSAVVAGNYLSHNYKENSWPSKKKELTEVRRKYFKKIRDNDLLNEYFHSQKKVDESFIENLNGISKEYPPWLTYWLTTFASSKFGEFIDKDDITRISKEKFDVDTECQSLRNYKVNWLDEIDESLCSHLVFTKILLHFLNSSSAVIQDYSCISIALDSNNLVLLAKWNQVMPFNLNKFYSKLQNGTGGLTKYIRSIKDLLLSQGNLELYEAVLDEDDVLLFDLEDYFHKSRTIKTNSCKSLSYFLKINFEYK